MSETSTAPEVTVVPELPELTYEYQPLDDLNRPMGGRQVIKYRTQQELIEKLTKQNVEIVKELRKEKKRRLLGEIDKDEIAPEVALSDAFAPPRELTPDENIQLSKDLLDPEKSAEARGRLIEAELGAPPKKIRQKLDTVDLLLARSECEAFLNTEPRYYKCPENFETLTSWMVKNNLAPTRANFSYAFEKLNKSDYLISAPIVREEAHTPAPALVAEPEIVATVANSQPPQAEPSRITSEEPAPEKRANVAVSSGLTRDTSSDEGVPVTQRGITLADIDKMPSNVYKERLKDPAFRKAVEELLNPQPVQQQ